MRRVVVTGLGMVSPLASGVEETWSRLLAGQSGAGTITRFDPERVTTKYACEVPYGDGSDGTFNPDDWMAPKERRKLQRGQLNIHLLGGRARAGSRGGKAHKVAVAATRSPWVRAVRNATRLFCLADSPRLAWARSSGRARRAANSAPLALRSGQARCSRVSVA